MMRKSVLLFLALLLPVSIFLFLHFFGRNEFDIPIHYQSAPAEIPADCAIAYQFPYIVSKTSINLQGPSVIFFASGLSIDAFRESAFQLDRLANEFEKNKPQLFIIIQSTDSLSLLAQPNALVLEKNAYEMEQRCVFLANGSRVVMVDSLQQIRGLYEAATLKEVDRLILELKILFKEY